MHYIDCLPRFCSAPPSVLRMVVTGSLLSEKQKLYDAVIARCAAAGCSDLRPTCHILLYYVPAQNALPKHRLASAWRDLPRLSRAREFLEAGGRHAFLNPSTPFPNSPIRALGDMHSACLSAVKTKRSRR